MGNSEQRALVAPSKLRQELNKVREAAEVQDSEDELREKGQSKPRLRVTLSNLILLLPAESKEIGRAELDSLVTELCVSHPSRLFILRVDADQEDSLLETSVSSRCVLTRSGAHVCSEEIYLKASPASLPAASNLILSLMNPDVNSTVLFFVDPSTYPAEVRKALCRLELLSSGTVYDSSFFSNYSKAVQFITSAEGGRSELSQSSYGQPVAENKNSRDISWVRLEKYRGLIAEQFDGQRGVGSAESIERVKISFCSPGAAETGSTMVVGDALVLAGWIVGALGWRMEAASTDGGHLSLRARTLQGDKRYLEFLSEPRESVSALSADTFVSRVELEFKDTESKVSIAHEYGEELFLIGTINKSERLTEQSPYVRKVSFVREVFDAQVVRAVSFNGAEASFRDTLHNSLAIADVMP